MSGMTWTWRGAAAAAMGLAMAVTATAPGAAVTAMAQAPAAPGGAAVEGIKVHGRWTIEVRNVDGSVVQRHQFSNALSPINGQRVLAGLLGRFYKGISQWVIFLGGPPLSACVTGAIGCPVYEYLGVGAPPMGTLKVTVPTFAPSPNVIIPSDGTVALSATTQFLLAGSIQSVRTELDLCRDAACAATDRYWFTEHTLPSTINVAANQIVQITVVLSFS